MMFALEGLAASLLLGFVEAKAVDMNVLPSLRDALNRLESLEMFLGGPFNIQSVIMVTTNATHYIRLCKCAASYVDPGEAQNSRLTSPSCLIYRRGCRHVATRYSSRRLSIIMLQCRIRVSVSPRPLSRLTFNRDTNDALRILWTHRYGYASSLILFLGRAGQDTLRSGSTPSSTKVKHVHKGSPNSQDAVGSDRSDMVQRSVPNIFNPCPGFFRSHSLRDAIPSACRGMS